ncbi:MAG TPA: hypothetical protein VN326_12445 [Casimicrobiaceae bacterium]|nr:hypothetical protein [Casimicrobiaceae bacterium]
MSEPAAATGPVRTRAQMQTWGLIGIALVLYGVLRFVFGPLPQDPSYHILADTRLCGFIPRAGDVLTKLSILTAGVAGVFLYRRVQIEREERAAYALLVAGMLLTAFGSAHYHWAPGDARLVWDRLHMTLVGGTCARCRHDRGGALGQRDLLRDRHVRFRPQRQASPCRRAAGMHARLAGAARAVLAASSLLAHEVIPGSAANRLLQRHGHRLLSLPETKLQTRQRTLRAGGVT